MNWYLGWQDGAALLLALLGLAFARWLHRKAATPTGCGRCPMLQTPVKGSVDRDDSKVDEQKVSSAPRT